MAHAVVAIPMKPHDEIADQPTGVSPGAPVVAEPPPTQPAAENDLANLMGGEVPRRLAPRQRVAAAFRRVQAKSGPNRTDALLQGLLAINLIVVGVLLAFAGPNAETTPAAPAAADRLGGPRLIGGLPTEQLWEQAVAAAGVGDYAAAVAQLQRYVEQTPSMHDVERQLVFNQIAYYLVKDGRPDEAQTYSVRAQQLMQRAYLPEDLLRRAELAQREGAVPEMRSAYARFLLQLEQASPAFRRREAEAFLMLGDSYRMQADQPEGAATPAGRGR